MKPVYIIHGWEGSPDEPLHQWLKSELIKNNFEVIAPLMPNPEKPIIKDWVTRLQGIVESPNHDTILVGHSIGCQAILRYLETLQPGQSVGGVVLIAPWLTPSGLETEEEKQIAKPWIETPIQDSFVVKHISKMTAIFSDNDPFVSREDMIMFDKRFGAEIIIESNKGHFTAENGITDLPSALQAIMAM